MVNVHTIFTIEQVDFGFGVYIRENPFSCYILVKLNLKEPGIDACIYGFNLFANTLTNIFENNNHQPHLYSRSLKIERKIQVQNFQQKAPFLPFSRMIDRVK